MKPIMLSAVLGAFSVLALPAAAAPAASAVTAAQDAEILKSGSFAGYEGHAGGGTARIVQEGDQLFLDFEDFRVDRGPRLEVWLAAGPVTTNREALDSDYVSLGRLQGARRASQRYEIPADIDIDAYDTVVIWCDPFSILFASAAID